MEMYKLKLAILFGSRARSTNSASSDYDVAVLGNERLELKTRAEILRRLGKILGASEDQIDLVDLRDASPLLGWSAAQTGRLLYGNKADFLRFRVLAWKRYLDTAKFRRVRDKALSLRHGRNS